MKKGVLLVLFGMLALSLKAQIIGSDGRNRLFEGDSTSFNNEVQIKLDGKTVYTDYKVISIDHDTTLIDTTLTLAKDFKINYLRKDNFELLPFHNQGQSFNRLGYNFENNSLLPRMGMTSKQFNYYKIEDIYYYHVPTPTTELMYRTGLEQGQMLDAFITMNTSRQLNFSIAYKGLRSLGKYRNALSSHGNFRTSFNYSSINDKYQLRGHFSSFDLLNQENGGLLPFSIEFFEENDPNYTDRGRLEVNFTNAENMMEGKRYFIDHSYRLFSKTANIKQHNDSIHKKIRNYHSILRQIENLKISTSSLSKKLNKLRRTKPTIKPDSTNVLSALDSLEIKEAKLFQDSIRKMNLKMIDSLTVLAVQTKIDSSQLMSVDKNTLLDLKIGHTAHYETLHYRFKQSAASAVFGDALDTNIYDHTSYQKSDNQLYAQLNSAAIGMLKAKINYFNYNYHYNSVLYFDEGTVPDKLKGNTLVFGADWYKEFGAFSLQANAGQVISGDLTGTTVKALISIKKDSLFNFKGYAEVTSKSPDFNKLLYQSDYKDFNWHNNFSNEEIKIVGVAFNSAKWGNLQASYQLIDNYTYFDENSSPVQASETLNYLKVKASKAFTWGKFTLDNTVMYQQVSKGDSFFKVPELVTRNSLYYSNYLFKGKPLYLQTGVTLKYFTEFNAAAYNPLLSEFVLQNDVKIGNFPLLDFFVNGQIRRTRLYLKVENFGASFIGRNYYSAPNYPYRDLTVRFGLVWNFFI